MAKKRNHSSLTSLLRYSSKKKSALISKKWGLFLSLGVVIIVTAIGIGAFIYKHNPDETELADYPQAIDPSSIHVDFTGEGVEPLTPSQRASLQQEVRGLLALPNRDLKKITSYVQKETNAGEVSILQTRFDAFQVEITARHPVFLVLTDKWRYLSSTGQIYGEKNLSTPSLPQITGIMDNVENIEFRDDGSVLLNIDEEARVKSLLALHEELNERELVANRYRYVRFRGFEIHLEKSDTLIYLGMDDHKEKINKLASILAEMKQAGKQAQIIELDYKGKAFVKERKF